MYGFEQFLEICADGQVGVLRGLIGALDGHLALVLVGVGVLAGRLLVLLWMGREVRNSSCSAFSSVLEEMEEPSTSICSSAWSFSILVVFYISDLFMGVI